MSNQGRVVIAALSLSAAGFVGIAMNEGYTDHAVIPVPGDVPTMGFGSTAGVKLGDTTTPPKALARAFREVVVFESGIKRCVHVPLHQYEYDVYVDFAYNVGLTRFCNSTMVKMLNASDYAGACAQFDKFTFYQGKDCRAPENKRTCGGLVTRRAEARAKCEGR